LSNISVLERSSECAAVAAVVVVVVVVKGNVMILPHAVVTETSSDISAMLRTLAQKLLETPCLKTGSPLPR